MRALTRKATGIGAVVAAAASLGAATASGHPPRTAVATRLPTALASDGNGYRVRPSSIYDTGDGSGVIGVLRARGGERGAGRGYLRWRRWTSTRADATGTYWLKLGTPVGTSPFTRTSLTLALTRVRFGHFTRMSLRYRQGGRPAHATLCVPDRGRVLEWGELLRGRCG